MNDKKIWLSSPHMGNQEKMFVEEAFATNWIAPIGPHVTNFEADLQDYLGISNVAALSSGTAALHLALILCGVQPNDIVLCQSFTFSASANPIKYLGATPVFIDSERDTWNISPEELEKAIQFYIQSNKKPKAIIVVHLYGMPAKMNEIQNIASKYEISLIEDAAEALGSSYCEKACGTFGKFGVLSFNGNKIITTSGGGALTGADEDLIARARYLATQARDPAPHYQHSVVGYNYRLTNVLAGIGRGQMTVLPERVLQRRANFNRYFGYFDQKKSKGYTINFQDESEGYYSNRWLTCILVDPELNKGITREFIRLELEKENIESRPLWKPMHTQPVFQDEPFFGSGVAERLFEIGLCLPSGSNLLAEDFDRIFKVLDSIFT